MTTVTLSSKGQIVLPADLRRRLGLAPGARLEIVGDAEGIHLLPVRPASAVPLARLAGLVTAPTTGKPRRLQDFDPASLLAREPRDRKA